MEIQWPLVLFTLLTGMGGCMLLFVCANEFKRFSQKDPFVSGLVAFVVTVVGGFASVLHLSHPENIMNALTRPSSGIFVEAALIGIMCVFVAVFLILVKRGKRNVAKVFAVLGAVFGLALSFMAGHSYIMVAYDAWNTELLPLAYLGTSLAMGSTLYWVIACPGEENGSLLIALATVACGAVSFLTVLAYSLVSGAFSFAPVYIGFSLAGAAVTVAFGLAGRRKPGRQIAIIALAAAVVSGLCFRMAMWAVGMNVYGFFS